MDVRWALYFMIEVAWKLTRGRPEAISWTILVLAAIICVPLDIINERLPWDMPLWQQASLGGLGITTAELVAGLVLNVWLGLGIWDYSHLSLNLWGQISVAWSALWVLVAGGASSCSTGCGTGFAMRGGLYINEPDLSIRITPATPETTRVSGRRR